MSLTLMGRKVGMTQIYNEQGIATPVSVILLGPCQLVDKKTVNGKQMGVIGYQEKSKNVSKPIEGYYKKLTEKSGKTITPKEYIKQVYLEDTSSEIGVIFSVDYFKEASKVDITGVSKGKGFQGAMKRHGMHGGPASHGSRFHRLTGSIGSNTFPAKVWKGQKMPGQTGNVRFTVKNLKIVLIDEEKGLLLVKGAIPGAKRGLVYINRSMEG